METARKIILADDDPVMRELASTKLVEAGYYVYTAVNGIEALSLLRRHGADLVISDLDMPALNGFELTEAIRSDDALWETPVIVITGSDRGDAVDRAFAAGANSFLAKPMNWSLFHHAVKFVLRAHDDRRALRTARDQAEAGAKFKDALMSVMSHELRTPLNAIIGFGQLISDRFTKQSDNLHREYAEYIVDSGKRLLNSVSDMLLASEARSGSIAINEADTALGPLLDEAMAGLEKTLRVAGAELMLRIHSRAAVVRCDRALIARAVQKLIDNAVKFSPKGVKIVLGTALTRKGEIAILVKDNGPGVEAERFEELTAPFSQLDLSSRRPHEGLGLGLPLANVIAAAHGGSLRLDRIPEGGVRAIILLPASRVRSAPARGGERRADTHQDVA